ncbi:ribosomal RNA-processing protein 8, putative [Plasmodium malariae]|uniref:Ribosomal RNA-processing protein 8 n=1 Tax=Plasmodium malariae TaxID=5858 RepID=A0A1C3KBY7_PLAMA|nr:ribosomal RNA-processing protein 8, putative [Plasmodium malariae]
MKEVTRRKDKLNMEQNDTKNDLTIGHIIVKNKDNVVKKNNSGYSIKSGKKNKNSVHAKRKKRLIDKKQVKKKRKINKVKNEEDKKECKQFANSNSMVEYNINKVVYDINKNDLIRGDDNNYKNVYLERNKQKYKKKKKIEKTPEDIVNSSLFRYINEFMYTNKSETVQKKLNETKNVFNIYHMGYKNQKDKWPNNPVNDIIKYLRKNFTKIDKIADLGCGEAEIAKTLSGWSISSFDLIKFNEYVTACNITHLPLSNNSQDCIIICLSLMNTDWPKIIFESVRCLKKKATLIIADVVSRFTNYKAFVKFMSNVGCTLSNQVNLDNFFYIFFFENNKKDNVSLTVNEGKVKKFSKLLAPCFYKRR